MKVEFMHIDGKGLSIVISDFNISDFGANRMTNGTVVAFSDIKAIADCIRNGHKIAAIKELRAQTGWGLKESKEYIDKWTSDYNHHSYIEDRQRQQNNTLADKFIKDHQIIDFLNDNEFKI
jgi:hypothetical protein